MEKNTKKTSKESFFSGSQEETMGFNAAMADEDVPEAESVTKKAKKSSSFKKWGVAGHRFTQIPNILLEGKKALNINDAELVVLLHLIKHWWTEDNLPFRAKSKLAEITGKHERQIQRILHSLENNHVPIEKGWSKSPGYIQRIEHYTESGRQVSNRFDLSKLKNALLHLSYEVEKAKQEVTRGPDEEKEKYKKPRKRPNPLDIGEFY